MKFIENKFIDNSKMIELGYEAATLLTQSEEICSFVTFLISLLQSARFQVRLKIVHSATAKEARTLRFHIHGKVLVRTGYEIGITKRRRKTLETKRH